MKIWKFDGKNFALWKEMMQDVLTIRRQVEEIFQSDKLASMLAEEWRSMDEIANNVYFSIAKEMSTFSRWEKL